MSHFIEINKHFEIDTNFWELNPQLVIISPFAELYKRDSSKNHVNSSKEAWAIFLFTENSARSKLYRLNEEDRKKEIEQNYCEHIDWNDDLIKKCIERYPILCMSAVERALKDEEDFLIRRANFIKDQEYILTYTEVIDGKPVKIEGNVKELETMAKATKSIWDNYHKVLAEFVTEEDKSNIKGGRKESKSERGEV